MPPSPPAFPTSPPTYYPSSRSSDRPSLIKESVVKFKQTTLSVAQDFISGESNFLMHRAFVLKARDEEAKEEARQEIRGVMGWLEGVMDKYRDEVVKIWSLVDLDGDMIMRMRPCMRHWGYARSTTMLPRQAALPLDPKDDETATDDDGKEDKDARDGRGDKGEDGEG